MTYSDGRVYGRKGRVLEYMSKLPPLPIREIAAREGITERYTRSLIKGLEQEFGLVYSGWGVRYKAVMTNGTYPLRSRLADQLHHILQEVGCRATVAALIGLNTREQVRAVNRPFAHDWTLSQIERLEQVHTDMSCGELELL